MSDTKNLPEPNSPKDSETLGESAIQPAEVVVPRSSAAKQPSGSVRYSSAYEGPIPPPDLVKQYEKIMPGAAEFFFDQVRQNAEHRRARETQAITSEIDDQRAERSERKRGQVFGFWLAALAIVLSVVAVLWNPSAATATFASVLGGTTVIGLTTIFVLGRRPQGAGVSDEDSSEHAEQGDPGQTRAGEALELNGISSNDRV